MPPCHGGDRGFKSPRGRQIASKTPVSPVESPPYNGLKSVVFKSLASFFDEKGMAVLGPDFRRISLLKVPLTYSGFASSLMVLTSKKLSWRFSHEDRTSHSPHRKVFATFRRDEIRELVKIV